MRTQTGVEQYRDSGSPVSRAEAVERIAVIGAGLMGHGIALTYALSGRTVALHDVDPEVLDEAEERIRSAHGVLADRREVDSASAVLDRIAFEPELGGAVDGADFVTEAVAERMEVKKQVFRNLDSRAPGEAVLATNTSGLSITEIGSVVDDPSRVVGTHWFNPPYVVPLVEVVRGDETGDEAVELSRTLLEDAGKTAVEVEKDVPGFVGNRIQLAMAYEAFSLLERGVASAEEIDKAVRAGFGFRLPVLGIFEKIDQSGLDVEYEVESYLLETLDRGIEPSDLLADLVEDGHHGLETGRGIYDWSDADPEEVYRDRDEALLSILDTYQSLEAGE